MNRTEQMSILVVTCNHAQFIDNLLNSLVNFGIKNVYFCDANSSDGTAIKLMNSSFSKNVLLKSHLEGFSKNNNDLIRHFNLKSQYYLLLNPDTYFDNNFIEVLLSRVISDKQIGIIGPQLRYPDGKIQITWKRFPSFLNVVKKRLGFLNSLEEKSMIGPNIDWCLGACMLISKALLKANSTLLDERYRLYCEDIDICFEARARGFKVIGTDATYVYHHLNEKSAKKILSKYNYWNIMSIVKFIFKWNFLYIKVIREKRILK